jgi:integrase
MAWGITIMQQQTMQDYLDSVYVMSHSYSTVKSYKLAIINQNNCGFRYFLQQRYQIDEFEFVEQTKQEKFDVYPILRDFVIFLDKLQYKPQTIKSRLAAIKGYLRFLGLKIYSEDCKQIIKIPKNIKEFETPLTKEIILRILRNTPPRLQTVILVLASSGMRIGELVQLKLSDIDLLTTPTTIRLRAQITKTRQSRETFISSEATKALKDYLSVTFDWKENKDNSHLDDVIIFGRGTLGGYKKKSSIKSPEHLAASESLSRQLRLHLAKVPDLDKNNPDGSKMIHFHAFRKFFRTTVGNVVGRDFAEAIIGHGFYMDTYYQLSEEKKKQMYLDAEPFLTISDFEAVEKNFKTLSEKNTQLEIKFEELMEYLRTKSIQIPFTVKPRN